MATKVAEPGAMVLAGGRSQRMGTLKAELKFGEATLLDVIVGRLKKAFREVVVVAPPAALAELKLADPAGVRIVHDPVPFQGPLAGLKRGLEVATGDPLFVCSCDLPMLSMPVAIELCSMLGYYDAAIPEVGGMLQPLHAAYRKRCAGAIDQLIERGERRALALAEVLKVRKIGEHHLRLLDPGLMSFYNINTPDEYRAALQMGGFPH
jgi:molybdenum cofactor guanylyltransferase